METQHQDESVPVYQYGPAVQRLQRNARLEDRRAKPALAGQADPAAHTRKRLSCLFHSRLLMYDTIEKCGINKTTLLCAHLSGQRFISN